MTQSTMKELIDKSRIVNATENSHKFKSSLEKKRGEDSHNFYNQYSSVLSLCKHVFL